MRLKTVLAAVFLAFMAGGFADSAQERMKAFPGAVGWAAYTPGGRGGKIIRVTSLDSEGAGSLAEAVRAKGPRIIVFEVGGVIDLKKSVIRIAEPYLTIAGQTAPSPGITLIKGGITIQTHDVIIRHIRVRAGEAGAAKKSGWEVDSIAGSGADAYNIIVDHCSCAWAIDENLSASGPRFEGATIEQWQKGTSRVVTLSNCIIAEGLNNSTHSKGAHSKGTLIHDNCRKIAIIGNLYANNARRNPYFKGGARGIVANNYIYNPASRAIHYGLSPGEWGDREYVTGQMVISGNILEHGPSTREGLALFVFQGAGRCEVFMEDNIAIDRSGKKVELIGKDSKANREECKLMEARIFWPEGLELLKADKVKDYVLKNAGARPWDRDEIDKRIVREVLSGKGRIIDSERDVGGYPSGKRARAVFNPKEWDLRYMVRRKTASGGR